jgi:hypothetical protein
MVKREKSMSILLTKLHSICDFRHSQIL